MDTRFFVVCMFSILKVWQLWPVGPLHFPARVLSIQSRSHVFLSFGIKDGRSTLNLFLKLRGNAERRWYFEVPLYFCGTPLLRGAQLQACTANVRTTFILFINSLRDFPSHNIGYTWFRFKTLTNPGKIDETLNEEWFPWNTNWRKGMAWGR